MRIVADLHLHSKYSRAVSKQMDLEHLSEWGKKKGIDLIATGDYTHPLWFSELKRKLEEEAPGIYRLKRSDPLQGSDLRTRFVLSTEISKIYSQGGAVRRIHNIVLAPSIESVEKLNKKLATIGNLYADGRPVFGMTSPDFLKLIKDIDPNFHLIPAHAWTPWFSLFGSKSGFDSIEECFRDQTEHIFAIETGLSSDPEMNWRLSALEKVGIVSFSDAHSPGNLMREATVFEVEKPDELNFDLLIRMMHEASPAFRANRAFPASRLDYTIEFFPEEGKYHYDGLREEGLRWAPEETKQHGGKSPKSGRLVTIGVLHRVDILADRPSGYRPPASPPFKRLVQLSQIIAESFRSLETNQKVQSEYERIVKEAGSELAVLVDLSIDEIGKLAGERLAEGVKRVRGGKIHVEPGYDGEYGVVKVFTEKEPVKQAQLF
jgi:uncharacterized protein (TIGR00375 family)